MKFWNARLKKATEYIPGEQPHDLEDFIKLNTNENPFPPSKAVLDALKNACNVSLRLYPDPLAMKVRGGFASDNDLSVDEVFVANGSDEIFTLIFRAFIEPDGIAAFSYPSYSLYYTLAEMNGIQFEKINLEPDLSFNLDKFLNKKYNLVIISNPNNPTGTYCEVKQIKAFLNKFKGLLVVDEAYIDFYGGSSVGLIKEYDNIIVTKTLSKSYSLAGLRVGIAAANKNIIRGFIKIKDSYNVDMLAQVGACAAMTDKKSFKSNMDMIRNNKEYLEERLEALGFFIVPSRANFIFVKHSKIASKTVFEKLRDKKIFVRYFEGPIRSEYLRISIGTMMEIKTLIKELESIVEE